MKLVFKFAIAWLAVWCQVVAVAAMPLGLLAPGVDPLGGVPICHANHDEGRGSPRPAQQPSDEHDCVLCVVCESQHAALALPAQQPVVAERQFIAYVRFEIAQPRAPPCTFVIAAQPRGPPSLI